MDRGSYYNETSSMSRDTRSDYHYLMAEMKAQNYDVIRFATYRTASKLRFIQKKTNLHLVDIWNIIEAFRENGLNALDSRLEITVTRLESLVASIYFQLNKRLSLQQQIDVEHSSAVLMNWLLATYDPEDIGSVRVFSVKAGLAIVCAGKITDKLRYIFSLISDVNGLLVFSKFADFLKEAMALPCSVYESPSFYFTDSLPRTVFDGQTAVTVNDFLGVMLSDPGPQCLMWFPLLHRMSSVESVLHAVQCEGCNREQFFGFRYKCQRCYNYQLCQDCFWRGRVSGNHTNQHEMKEYTSYKTPSKQLSHSIKKSFRVPDKPSSSLPRYPAKPERTLNLTHIVPPAPSATHNGFPEQYESSQYEGHLSRKSSQNLTNYDFYPGDEEHRLISRYANHLTNNSGESRSPSEISVSSDTMKQRELIAKLEAKNREIMREIIRLRKQQEQEDVALRSEQNPTLLAELRALRQRKEELENHLSGLQESRRELVLQLEALMKMLKTHSPHSTPNSSPLSLMSRSPPVYPLSSMSAPTTPGSNAPYGESLMGLGGDVRLAFGQAGSTRSLQNDLLLAADSVTSAMSSLVKELNYGCEDDGSGLGRNQLLYSGGLESEGPLDDLNIGDSYWSDEDEIQHRQSSQYFNEPQTSILSHQTSMLSHQTNEARETDLFDSMDPEIYQGQGSLTTDDESYVRTDEEEGGGTDWEDSMRRWINR